jgi:general secretion pathway protein G
MKLKNRLGNMRRRTVELVRGALVSGTNRQTEAGLTLIETIIVISIIIVFTTAAVIAVGSILGTSKDAAAKNQIATFKLALNMYLVNCGSYPSQEQGLAALRQKPTTEPVPEGWKGPYIDKEIPKDPWGHDFKYLVPGPAGDAFGVIAYGADGVEGGEGDNKDVTSWQ